jgi:hypothetical protein
MDACCDMNAANAKTCLDRRATLKCITILRAVSTVPVHCQAVVRAASAVPTDRRPSAIALSSTGVVKRVQRHTPRLIREETHSPIIDIIQAHHRADGPGSLHPPVDSNLGDVVALVVYVRFWPTPCAFLVVAREAAGGIVIPLDDLHQRSRVAEGVALAERIIPPLLDLVVEAAAEPTQPPARVRHVRDDEHDEVAEGDGGQHQRAAHEAAVALRVGGERAHEGQAARDGDASCCPANVERRPALALREGVHDDQEEKDDPATREAIVKLYHSQCQQRSFKCDCSGPCHGVYP